MGAGATFIRVVRRIDRHTLNLCKADRLLPRLHKNRRKVIRVQGEKPPEKAGEWSGSHGNPKRQSRETRRNAEALEHQAPWYRTPPQAKAPSALTQPLPSRPS